ncbi:beta strand repeat-containing protein [Singulisphaera sp. PoT]|uniref:beta strand repeat-containing protein n=1 Tax=Singulisphaera sp. PoT TaxID=3411797 RepID=UPI003BF486A5
MRRRRVEPLALEALEIRVTPATSTWTGAVSGAWSEAGNWDVAPANGNDLVFPSTAANLSNNNDLTSVDQFASLTIQAGGYTLAGNAINLNGPIDASQATGNSTLSLPIVVGGSTTVTVDNAAGSLTASGVISGAGGLTKAGPGSLILSSPNTYNAATTVSGGKLQVDGTQNASAVTVGSGATLSGVGTVGPVTSNSGTIAPGDTGTGILTDSGTLTMGTGSTLVVPINGTTAGTEYSQLKVAGQVNITGATLNATLGFTPTAHEQIVVIDNTGSQAVTGTFNGLAEGAELTLNGEEFQISYKGGDGNDVVLTHLLDSSTAVTSTPASPVVGQSVTLTATVTGTASQTPAGSVEFFNGATSLGSTTLVNGVGTLQLTNLPVGANSITAKYKGDINFAASTSPVSTVTIGQAATTTALTATPNPSPFGQSVTMTATVSVTSPGAGSPTGQVEFFSGTTSLGTVSITNGTASLQTTDIPTGTNTLTAQYKGDGNFQVSTSPGLAQTISATAATTTALSTSASSTTFGQSITLTANVSPNASSSTTLTGSVQFFSGTTSLGTSTLTNGVATLATTALPVGSDAVTAKYLGDSNFAPSTSAASTVTVSQASTTTSLTATPNPSPFGQPVTLTATISPVSPGTGTASGTVEFFSGTTSLGTATLAGGVATLKPTNIPVGTNSITAHYQGDTNFTASTSTAVSQTVTPTAATTTSLTTSASSIVFGQSVTLTANVAPSASSSSTISGSVEFFSGSTSLGTGTIANGVATLNTTALPLGSDSITAKYLGDSNFSPSTSAASTVTVAQAATTSTLTAAPSPAAVGQTVTLTATIKATSPGSGTPTGTVEFFNGTTSLGTGTVNSSGIATLQTLSLPLGSNSLTAVYSGDTNFTTSTSPAFTENILQGSTTTVNTSSSSIVFGQSVTLTATVSRSGTGSATPTGTVQFFSGSTSLGTGTLTNGTATLQSSAIPTGTNSITAVYQGDSTFASSTSAAITISVTQASTLTTLTANPTASSLGQTVTLTAAVTAVSPGSGTPTGTVTFSNGSTTLGTATLSNGVATLTTTALPLGTASITASYANTTNFASSSSSAATVTVSTANSNTTLTASQNPSLAGQQIILTATVRSANNPTNPTIPSGTVQFFNGTTLLGTVNLGATSQASLLVTTFVPAGTASFTAVYSGDTNYVKSTSNALSQVVIPGTTATSVGISGTATPNQPVTLTAFVGPLYPSNGQPTGTVNFLVNGKVVGSGTLVNGQATLSVSSLPVGTTSVLAVYTGDSNYQGSTSVSSLITVGNSTQLFVNKVYEQYLHTAPTNVALTRWTARLERGYPAAKFVQTIRRQALSQARRGH